MINTHILLASIFIVMFSYSEFPKSELIIVQQVFQENQKTDKCCLQSSTPQVTEAPDERYCLNKYTLEL